METDDDMTHSGGPQTASSFDRLLADEYVLYTKTRDAHWMIQGRNALDLHMVIERQYCTLDMIVGDLVERAHAAGLAGLGSLKDCLAITRLRGHDRVCRDPRRIMHELLLDHEMVIRRLRRDILVAGEQQRDPTMVKFLSGVMKHHQNMLDMLTVRVS
jgi:starvation-inducible DNA-binding protein